MKHSRSAGLVRVLIYFFPALMDMIVALVGFVNVVRLAKMGASASVVAGTVAVWSIVYMISCPLVGRRVTPGNAARFMMASCASMALLCVLFTVVPGIPGIYVLCGGTGAAAALFFPPFQVFMKAVDTAGEKPVAYSTGLYTFAWSEARLEGPIVYAFGRGRKCLYVGKGSSWKRLCSYVKSAYLLQATCVEVFCITTRSQLGKTECLATHLFNPRDNKMKASRTKWGKACPICKKHDEVQKDLKSLFKMK